jgi:hypothetical protein
MKDNDISKHRGPEQRLQPFGRYQIQSRAATPGKEQEEGLEGGFGISGIFSFPYRIYGNEELASLNGIKDGKSYRVHSMLDMNN